MGNEVSGQGDYYDGDEDDYAKQFDGIETLGYRVLGVQPDSPGKLGHWRVSVLFFFVKTTIKGIVFFIFVSLFHVGMRILRIKSKACQFNKFLLIHPFFSH